MPTNETPSAGAVAKRLFARFVYDDDDALGGEVTFTRSAMKQLREDIALALDAFAREREAAVWEAAAIRAHDMAIMAKAAGDIQGYYAASTLYDSYSARAAEARKTP